jgi:gluconolactonase
MKFKINIKMMKMKLLIILFALFSGTIYGQNKSIIAKNAEIAKPGTGYAFTEGPAVAPDGKVYFTDQPNDRIYVWDEKEGISLWLEGTRRSNGMYFNAKGNWLPVPICTINLVISMKIKRFISFMKDTTENC